MKTSATALRQLRLFLLALLTPLLLASAAMAADSITIDVGNALDFQGDTSGNDVTVSYAAGTYTISDTVSIINVTNNGTATVGGSGTNTVTVSGIVSLNLNSDGGTDTFHILSVNDPTSIDTAVGNPDTTIIGNGTLTGIQADVSVSDSGGVGSLIIDDSADPTGRTVNITPTQIIGASVGNISYESGITRLTFMGGQGADSIAADVGGQVGNLLLLLLSGGGGADYFTVTPSNLAGIQVSGNDPAPPANPGDTLNVVLAGTTNPQLTAGRTASGYQGVWTFDDRRPVGFDTIERLLPGSGEAPALSPAMSALLILVLAGLGVTALGSRRFASRR